MSRNKHLMFANLKQFQGNEIHQLPGLIHISVLEIKNNSKLSLFQKPGNQSHEFGCPDESLVVW